jgi:hypothetical protein
VHGRQAARRRLRGRGRHRRGWRRRRRRRRRLRLPDWRWRWRCRSIREIDDVRRRARWGRKGRSAGGGLRTLGPPRWVARRPSRGWGRRLEWHVGDNDARREQVARAPSLQRVVVAIGSAFLRRPAVVQQVACPPRRGGLDQGRLGGRRHDHHDATTISRACTGNR